MPVGLSFVLAFSLPVALEAEGLCKLAQPAPVYMLIETHPFAVPQAVA